MTKSIRDHHPPSYYYNMNQTQTPTQKAAQTVSSSTPQEGRSYVNLPLKRINFILMAVAGAVIVLGFLLMTGSPSTSTEFNPDIFSTRRIVIGPTIAFLGFIFMGVAIMWPFKKTDE